MGQKRSAGVTVMNIFLVIFLTVSIGYSQENEANSNLSQERGETIEPLSNVGYNDRLRAEAGLIVVGIVEDITDIHSQIGMTMEGPTPSSLYNFNAKIKVEKVIKGKVDGDYIIVGGQYWIREPIDISPEEYIKKKKIGKRVEFFSPFVRAVF